MEGDPCPHQRPRPPWGDETPAVDRALNWAARRTVSASDPKTGAKPADYLAAACGEMITPDGIGSEAALEIFSTHLVPATRATDDPMNLAYIPAAPTRAAVAFDLVVSASIIFGGVWETGAGGIFAENAALAWITSLLGWPESAAGCFVAGGTAGNLSALATARDNALRRRGARPAEGWILLAADSAHSSVTAAARLLDVELHLVPTGTHGKLHGGAVTDTLTALGPRAADVFAIVASGGTTNAGIVDDLAGIVAAAQAHRIWVHVDGAYGGAALCAPSARELFAGIEHADSFIVDPHKWLFAPYDCCALLYREPTKATLAHAQHASYLDYVERADANPADYAAHLSRRLRGLPLWFSLATHGTNRYAQAVEQGLATAREVAAFIEESDFLDLVMPPQLSVVLFTRRGWSEGDYASWSQRLAREGIMLCIPTSHEGETVLRLAFINPATRASDVIAVLAQTMQAQ